MPRYIRNPIPKHAPHFVIPYARYQKFYSTDKNYNGVIKPGSRFFYFEIGRSERLWVFKDEYRDDVAMHLLNNLKGQRLIIKGYNSQDRKTNMAWQIITHFGLYHLRKKGYFAVHPVTGEECLPNEDEGFYAMSTELK